MDNFQNYVSGGLFTVCLTFGGLLYSGIKERVNRIENKVDSLVEHLINKE